MQYFNAVLLIQKKLPLTAEVQGAVLPEDTVGPHILYKPSRT